MGRGQNFTTKQEIRKKIVEILLGKTDAKDKVFPNRTANVGVEELPVILVYPTSVDYTMLRKDPKILHRRDLSLTIQIMASDSDESKMTDTLDDISDQIEDAITNSDKLDELVHDINIDTAQASLSGEGQKPEGSWSMVYNVTFIKKPK